MSSVSPGLLNQRKPFDARLLLLLVPLACLPLALLPSWREGVGLALATFISEDATCILAGVLVSIERISWATALLGCGIGIFVSDLFLWLTGTSISLGLLRWPALSQSPFWKKSQSWVNERGGLAILMARFIPGSRLPVYLGAGLVRFPFRTMVWWTLLGTVLWTPFLIGMVVLLNSTFTESLEHWFGGVYWPLVILGSGCYLLVRLIPQLAKPLFRYRISSSIARFWRWEFWPSWLFYMPLIPYLAWLSIRYRSCTIWTTANPGIPLGGVIGESKSTILAHLPEPWIIASRLIASGIIQERIDQLQRILDETGWSFPIIAKPDAGQRGEGLKKVNTQDELASYLMNYPGDCILQPYHPGPYEAGIFYYRHPDETQGHIFSITDKRFPVIIGDGKSTLRELIWKHPRYRMQAGRFLERHTREADRVLHAKEQFSLAVAGNHCQGTLFLDGASLITPELERRVDAIAKHFNGFFIGRFDVRYSSVEAFMRGDDLAIVELNGVTSESTNIYDPSRSLLQAYQTLCRQWSLLYAIGHANAQHGTKPPGITALLRTVFTYYRTTRNLALGD
ncbi:MAG TPA: VTT domain-containing protein [Gemmatales bacterium]|nr:VTT domain-containing protein [Gemmatales bacterium]